MTPQELPSVRAQAKPVHLSELEPSVPEDEADDRKVPLENRTQGAAQ